MDIQFKIINVEPESLKDKEFNVDSSHTTLSQTETPIKDSWVWTRPYVLAKRILGG